MIPCGDSKKNPGKAEKGRGRQLDKHWLIVFVKRDIVLYLYFHPRETEYLLPALRTYLSKAEAEQLPTTAENSLRASVSLMLRWR